MFGSEENNSLSVSVGAFTVRVSRVTSAEEPEDDPTFSDFDTENRLRFDWALRGSSFASHSGAQVTLVTGPPGTAQVNVENAAAVLRVGDRCIISYDDTHLWAGYVTKANLLVSPERETVIYNLTGPEWVLGGRGYAARHIAFGQLRRTQAADATFVAGPDVTFTPVGGWARCNAERCIFNPGGRGNMSITPIVGNFGAEARCWDEPDRKHNGIALTEKWTRREAARTLFLWLNDSDFTGITCDSFDGVPDTDDLRDVEVEGMGLWEALIRVLGPDTGFYVTTTPDDDEWGGFKLRFFSRNTGPLADLHLNPIGTPPGDALASVTHLDVTGSIANTVTAARVLGKRIKHVVLTYDGPETTEGAATCLQHGWTPTDNDLSTYGDGEKEVTPVTIDSKGAAPRQKWRDRYTAQGKDFAKYKDVFRYFVWNEANEWNESGKYGTATVPHFAPNLTGIADGPDAPGQYFRRRRPLQDTQYLDTAIDAHRRQPPVLFFAIKKDGALGPWLRVPGSAYKLDPDRAGVWIAVDDLATWCPFEDAEAEDGAATVPYDYRSFATLLNQGVLRMALVGSIEQDQALEARAERTEDAGSQYVTEYIVRRDDSMVVSSAHAGAVNPLVLLTGVPIDESAAAQAEAEHLRTAGQDIQFHSSIMVAATWPEQAIGSIIQQINGRNIDLGTGGPRAAQIVAARIDATAMKWELLTESSVKSLRAHDRTRNVRKWSRKGR